MHKTVAKAIDDGGKKHHKKKDKVAQDAEDACAYNPVN